MLARYQVFILFIGMECCLLAGLFLFASYERKNAGPQIAAKKELVRQLGLTDLSVWTEARYTRHPSQADLFTAFQDFPSSVEHFPAGSLIRPVERLPRIPKNTGEHRLEPFRQSDCHG